MHNNKDYIKCQSPIEQRSERSTISKSSAPKISKTFIHQRITAHLEKNNSPKRVNKINSDQKYLEKDNSPKSVNYVNTDKEYLENEWNIDNQEISPVKINSLTWCPDMKFSKQRTVTFVSTPERYIKSDSSSVTSSVEEVRTRNIYTSIWSSSDNENNTSTNSEDIMNTPKSSRKHSPKSHKGAIKLNFKARRNLTPFSINKMKIEKTRTPQTKCDTIDPIDAYSSDFSVQVNTQSDEDYHMYLPQSTSTYVVPRRANKLPSKSGLFEISEVENKQTDDNQSDDVRFFQDPNSATHAIQPVYSPQVLKPQYVVRRQTPYSQPVQQVPPQTVSNFTSTTYSNNQYPDVQSNTDSVLYSETSSASVSDIPLPPLNNTVTYRNSLNYSSHRNPALNLIYKSPEMQGQQSPKIAPMYRKYQLIGDSQFVRFAEQILNYRYTSLTPDTSSRCIGLCVSGQTIEDLYRRVISKEYHISENIILLIGTNNIKKKSTLGQMNSSYSLLLSEIKKFAKNVVLLTVPPLPLLETDSIHWMLVESFNNHIRKCHNDNDVFVIDTASLFVSYNNSCSEDFFEKFYGRRTNKTDLIHLNYKGLKMIQTMLDLFYFKT